MIRTALLFAALLHAPDARAQLASTQSGFVFDVAGGFQAGDLPFTPGIGWTLGMGGWVGRYDQEFALGRHIGFLVRARQDLQFAEGRKSLRTAPQLEIRRAIDLLVVGVHFGVSGGPLFETALPTGGTRFAGGTVRVHGGVRYRFSQHWAASLRLEAGVDMEAPRVEPTMALLIGLEFAKPLRNTVRDEPDVPADAP